MISKSLKTLHQICLASLCYTSLRSIYHQSLTVKHLLLIFLNHVMLARACESYEAHFICSGYSRATSLQHTTHVFNAHEITTSDMILR